MNREIKFRGLSKEIGWVYGDLVINCTANPYIIDEHGFEWNIIVETVGQFTGLTDKNGKEIYEGDVLRNTHKYHANDICEGIVEFLDCQWFGGGDYLSYASEFCNMEIIGNIHDNPELLK